MQLLQFNVTFCRAHIVDDTFLDDALLAIGLEVLQRIENVETFNRRSGYSSGLSCGKFLNK